MQNDMYFLNFKIKHYKLRKLVKLQRRKCSLVNSMVQTLYCVLLFTMSVCAWLSVVTHQLDRPILTTSDLFPRLCQHSRAWYRRPKIEHCKCKFILRSPWCCFRQLNCLEKPTYFIDLGLSLLQALVLWSSLRSTWSSWPINKRSWNMQI